MNVVCWLELDDLGSAVLVSWVYPTTQQVTRSG